MKGALMGLLVVTIAVAGFVWLAGAGGAPTDPLDAYAEIDGVLVDAGVTRAQAEAFEAGKRYEGLGPTVTHPPDGSLYPASFPPPRIQWSDEYASRTYQVVLLSGDRVLFHGVTRKRELRLTSEAWTAVKAAGGPITIRVSGGVLEADGRILDDIGSSEDATMRVAHTDENPQGMLLFGQKHRPWHQPKGTVAFLMMHLRIDGFDMVKQEHRVLFRSSVGPDPTIVHATRMEEDRGPGPGEKRGHGPNDSRGGGPQGNGPDDGPAGYHGEGEVTHTQCVSCHAVSGDGEYIAVFSQTSEESPSSFDAPNGFLTILTMPKREIVIQLPHAFMPQFNPVDSSLIAFGSVDGTVGNKDMMIVKASDLHVLDLKTGEHAPLPGAAEPDHVENFPYWSPDGKTIAYIRTRKGEMWHGSAGHIDIATIPYNGGQGGTPELLNGASANQKSNFMPVYSRDGRWIVFTQTDKGFFSQQSADLMIVPAAGGEPRRLGCNSSHADTWHRFSPTGRWLGIVTNREDIRRPHIYISRFDTDTGTCTPAVQMPFVAGIGAHTHAFSWTTTWDWLEDFPLADDLPRRPTGPGE